MIEILSLDFQSNESESVNSNNLYITWLQVTEKFAINL